LSIVDFYSSEDDERIKKYCLLGSRTFGEWTLVEMIKASFE